MKWMLCGCAGIVLSMGAPLAFSQAVVPSLGPPMAPPLVAPVPAGVPLQFNDLSEVYRYIVQTRGLGQAGDEALVQALAGGSTVQHVRDISGDSLTVIKAELIADGASRVASANGNYPYYVLRHSEQGFALLGVMFGQGYVTSRADGHLQFTMRLRMEAGQLRPMRFQVRGNALVNLTPLKSQTAPYIA
jgi:hypothetical protein